MTRFLGLILALALSGYPVAQAWAFCCPPSESSMSMHDGGNSAPCHDGMATQMSAEKADAVDMHDHIGHSEHGGSCCHISANMATGLVVAMEALPPEPMAPFTELLRPDPEPARLFRPPSIC